MEELRLFRMALGAAELASAWAAVAPRKPERKAGQEGGDRETVRSAAAVPSKFLEIIAGCGEEKKKTSRGSYFAGIPSNCHQRHGQAERKEYLKFRQGRGRIKKKTPHTERVPVTDESMLLRALTMRCRLSEPRRRCKKTDRSRSVALTRAEFGSRNKARGFFWHAGL